MSDALLLFLCLAAAMIALAAIRARRGKPGRGMKGGRPRHYDDIHGGGED
ncbi:hypothetical protein [Pseudooceanicola aestuarii]|nr:hypothetical protein [Pseudooceanicola aestuarii]